jgi:hypothetical protein
MAKSEPPDPTPPACAGHADSRGAGPDVAYMMTGGSEAPAEQDQPEDREPLARCFRPSDLECQAADEDSSRQSQAEQATALGRSHGQLGADGGEFDGPLN